MTGLFVKVEDLASSKVKDIKRKSGKVFSTPVVSFNESACLEAIIRCKSDKIGSIMLISSGDAQLDLALKTKLMNLATVKEVVISIHISNVSSDYELVFDTKTESMQFKIPTVSDLRIANSFFYASDDNVIFEKLGFEIPTEEDEPDK